MAQQSTKSTVNAEALDEEDCKIADDGGSNDQTKKPTNKGKKRVARNRTKILPTVEAGDFIDGDSDDEEFKQAIAKAAAEAELEDSGRPEDSEVFLASKDVAAALLDDSDTEDEEKNDAKAHQEDEEEEFKKPVKAAKKAPAKKDKAAKAEKGETKGKAEAAPANKHAKVAVSKVMMSENEAKTAVKAYMEQQNRPYSIQNVLDNMHGRIHRKICQQVLDELTDEKHLVCKEFGKAKIYLANQDNFAETSTDQLAELDRQISDKKKVLDEAKDRLKILQAQLKDITGTMTNTNYVTQIEKLKASNAEAESRL